MIESITYPGRFRLLLSLIMYSSKAGEWGWWYVGTGSATGDINSLQTTNLLEDADEIRLENNENPFYTTRLQNFGMASPKEINMLFFRRVFSR
jgi:hypothetical protein